MIPVASAKELVEVEQAAERIAAGISNWITRRVAHRLINAGLVLQSLNAYDHQCRATFGPLLSFSPGWPQDQRTEAVSRIDIFVQEQVIYRTLQRNLPALRKYVNRQLYMPSDRRQAGKRLADAGGGYEKLMLKVREAKGVWLWTNRTNPEEAVDFRPMREEIRNGTDAAKVTSWATSIYEPIQRDGESLLDAVNYGYGLFADDITNRHVKLVNLKDLDINLSGVK